MLLTIVVFIIILGILVFVHELGHFVVARRNGIKAEEFGLGFPPRFVGIQFIKTKEGEPSPEKKWRIIWGRDGDDEEEKQDLHQMHKKKFIGGTIYSLNWLPIGGFVRIKGEDGEGKNDSDSFASKSPWIRAKVLIAGVGMNLILAWILLSITFMAGSYQDVTGEQNPDSKIIIESIEKGSPAEKMGLEIGDILVKDGNSIAFSSVKNVQDYISSNKGNEISLIVQRKNKEILLSGIPRTEVQEGHGLLGISGMGEVITVRYPFFQAFWKGFTEIGNMFVMIFQIISALFQGEKTGLEVTGPVNLAILTGQIIPLGFVFVLRFIAVISINLAIINALPFPALDGGRILFILIEKIKGSPVNQKVEQVFHTIGMAILMFLMLFITAKEIFALDFIAKIKNFL